MDNNVKRSFIIGDHWLYYKLYTGYKTADLILTDIIQPITEKLIDKQCIDSWFFIRYADPKEHLRVRFYIKNLDQIGNVIQLIAQELEDFIEKDLIWKVQIDTYQREIERYGSNTIEKAEQLFYHDSVMITKLIDLIEGDEGEEIRWLFGLRAIDSLLDSFQYTNEEKLKLLHRLKTGFRQEFGVSKLLNTQLKDKYRVARKKIDDFMLFTASDIPEYEPILDILEEKQKHCKGIAKEIVNLRSQNQLEKDLDDFMASYIHMLMNRLFTSKNRLHEMVCYDFLYKYYISMIALQKQKVDV